MYCHHWIGVTANMVLTPGMMVSKSVAVADKEHARCIQGFRLNTLCAQAQDRTLYALNISAYTAVRNDCVVALREPCTLTSEWLGLWQMR